MRFKVKNTLFSTYCTLLLLLYALSFWNASIFTKLIVLRSEACSDWPVIQCVVIGRIPQAETERLRPLPYWDAMSRHDDTKTAFNRICLHLWSEKWQTTSTNLHCSKLTFESSVAEMYLLCESEASDCPYKVGISPLYRKSLCERQPCRLLATHTLIFGLNCSGAVL